MNTNQHLVINNFEEKLKVFTNAVSGELTSEEDFVIANTGIPTDTFNVLLSKSPNIKNAVKIRQEMTNLMVKKHPFCVWMDAQYVSNDWKKLMQEYDLVEAERNVMMKLDNTLNVGQYSQQMMITQVRSNEELLKYEEIFLSLFEGTQEKLALESYFNQFSYEKLSSAVKMFIGCIDEVPVSTGLLIESKDSYGIYDVMTKATYRGKGYGSEMFHYLLNQTKDKEKPVVLQASDDGENIYKRFGFIDIGEMVVFE